MKHLALTSLAALLTFSLAVDAYASTRKHKVREGRTYYRYAEPRTRSNTVAPNGLCQRDTGTPNSSLSFRNKCDVEEFWERQRRSNGIR